MSDQPGIVRADPVARRRLVWGGLVALALLLLGLVRGLPALLAWLAADRGTLPVTRQRIVCLSFGGLMVALAAAVIWSGRRIARWGGAAARIGRFPPPGMPVVRDSRVLTGRVATALGRVYGGLGWGLVTAGAALLVLGGYVVVALWP